MGVIKIEGKSVTLDDQIIDAGPEAIKAALSVDFPDVENAHIEVIGSRAPGVVRSASVVKQGTGKGVDINLTGSHAVLGVKKTSVEDHVYTGATSAVKEMFRRYELTRFAGAVVDLIITQCGCGSSDPHPDSHFVVIVAGPFHSSEEAMDAVDQVAKQRAQVLSYNSRLLRTNNTGADS
jgi:hypothetical protein